MKNVGRKVSAKPRSLEKQTSSPQYTTHAPASPPAKQPAKTQTRQGRWGLQLMARFNSSLPQTLVNFSFWSQPKLCRISRSVEVQHASSPFPDNAAKLQGTHFVISTFMSPAEVLRLTPDQAVAHLGEPQAWRATGGQGTQQGGSMRTKVHKREHSNGCLDRSTGIQGVSKRD